MGKLIATGQATLDGVIDPVGAWVQADGDHGDYSFKRQARSGGLVLGRKTYEGLGRVLARPNRREGPDRRVRGLPEPARPGPALVPGAALTQAPRNALTNRPTKAS
jgi:hypothetical protein